MKTADSAQAVRPRLSVITVVRNGEKVIKGCIDSVLAQGIEGLQYIVIDGASTDGTMEIVRSYGDAISICVSEPDKGLYDAMNKGLRFATGEFVHFLNSDDRYLNSDVLSSVLPKLMDGEVTYGQIVYVEEDGTRRTLGEPFSWKRELRGSCVPHMSLFVPNSCFEEVGQFDLSLRIAADYDLVLRLARRFPMRFLPLPISEMHAGGFSYQNPYASFRESSLVAKRYGRSRRGSFLDFAMKSGKWWLVHNMPSWTWRWLR